MEIPPRCRPKRRRERPFFRPLAATGRTSDEYVCNLRRVSRGESTFPPFRRILKVPQGRGFRGAASPDLPHRSSAPGDGPFVRRLRTDNLPPTTGPAPRRNTIRTFSAAVPSASYFGSGNRGTTLPSAGRRPPGPRSRRAPRSCPPARQAARVRRPACTGSPSCRRPRRRRRNAAAPERLQPVFKPVSSMRAAISGGGKRSLGARMAGGTADRTSSGDPGPADRRLRRGDPYSFSAFGRHSSAMRCARSSSDFDSRFAMLSRNSTATSRFSSAIREAARLAHTCARR